MDPVTMDEPSIFIVNLIQTYVIMPFDGDLLNYIKIAQFIDLQNINP